MKIHLGCGKRYIPGFVHVDLADFPHISYKQDVRDLSNFKDNSAELVYACQVLEYFDREEVSEVLKEWTRVLKQGGVLRLSVPNFELLSRLYQEKKVNLESLLGTLYGKIPLAKNYIYHKTTYDEPSLKKLLEEAGYKNIERWDWRKTEHADVDDFSQAYHPHMDKEHGVLFNLNMQGVKK